MTWQSQSNFGNPKHRKSGHSNNSKNFTGMKKKAGVGRKKKIRVKHKHVNKYAQEK